MTSIPPLSRAQLRRIDHLAAHRFGLPTIVLMENAARGIAHSALRFARRTRAHGAVIVCGKGNNGGDGLAAARHLSLAGFPVVLLLAAKPDEFTGDAAVHLGVARAMRIPIQSAGRSPATALARARLRLRHAHRPWLLIDALFGTGLTRPVTGKAADLIAAINASRDHGARVIAVDLPSGMDADTARGLGPPHAPMVHAHLTLTMAAPKLGFARPGARRWTGRIEVIPIAAPATPR